MRHKYLETNRILFLANSLDCFHDIVTKIVLERALQFLSLSTLISCIDDFADVIEFEFMFRLSYITYFIGYVKQR